MPDNVKGAKLGAIHWRKFTTSGSEEVRKADPKPAAKAAVKTVEPVAKPSDDTLDVKAPARGASGASVKEQVARIDHELVSLSRALDRNQHELSGAKVERAQLDALLAQKLDDAEHIAGDLSDSREQKAKIQQEIASIKGQMSGLDSHIGDLQAEQKGLLAREAQLGVKHRKAYDAAAGAENYAKYLKTLPESAKADGELSTTQGAAASGDAKRAKEELQQTESEIRSTNADEAIVDIEQVFAQKRRGALNAKGRAAEGVLDNTDKKIDDLRGQQSQANKGILDTTGQMDQTEAQIKKTEKNIAALQGKIGDLEKLRDEVLEVAIHAQEEDAKELMAKIDQLKSAIEGLKVDLKQDQQDLKDLKDLQAK